MVFFYPQAQYEGNLVYYSPDFLFGTGGGGGSEGEFSDRGSPGKKAVKRK